jgi:hypothetical protein
MGVVIAVTSNLLTQLLVCPLGKHNILPWRLFQLKCTVLASFSLGRETCEFVVLRAVSDSLSKLCSTSSTPLVRVHPSDLVDMEDFWREMAAGRVLPLVLNIDLQELRCKVLFRNEYVCLLDKSSAMDRNQHSQIPC